MKKGRCEVIFPRNKIKGKTSEFDIFRNLSMYLTLGVCLFCFQAKWSRNSICAKKHSGLPELSALRSNPGLTTKVQAIQVPHYRSCGC